MAKAALKVYLDHLIKRDNLLYKRAVKDVDPAEDRTERASHLAIRDLYGDRSKERLLRKPDFQRATWAWSPEDCVELLGSVLEEQVVPSVIMWLSPDGEQYVLDGGHRISVLLAWIKDNWGDRVSSSEFNNPSLERDSKDAALRVRELMGQKGIGKFDDYKTAEERYTQLLSAGRNPESEMDSTSVRYAKLARKWESVNIGFPVLWVKGNYEKAEESFLKINKRGRQLSEWETKLVENRSSSFARTIMSIAQVHNAEHCWPKQNTEEEPGDNLKVDAILEKLHNLHKLLFHPLYKLPIDSPKQPLLVTPRPEKTPEWLAELLTVTEGKKGQKPETEFLIQRDKNERISTIIANGLRLVDDTMDVLSNIYGPSPRSLTLMPLVYFYNKQGTYVRSLLYGMIYWLNHGTESRDVLNRKLIFSAHRRSFEEVLIENKGNIIKRIGRRIGSGPEVTYKTARYYHGLLELLLKHEDKVESTEFRKEHQDFVATLRRDKSETEGQELVTDEPEKENVSRLFQKQQKVERQVTSFLGKFDLCEICGGRYYPGLFTQFDHIQPHAKGGKTVLSNARETHPFCNNNREMIEKIRDGKMPLELPAFDNPEKLPEQLKLLFIREETGFDENLEEDEITEDEITDDVQ